MLASDVSHFYENMASERPFTTAFHIGEMLEGFDRLLALAPDESHIIPGHDPLVMKLYPAPSPSWKASWCASTCRPPGRRQLAPATRPVTSGTGIAESYFSLAAFRIGSNRAASLFTSSASAFGPRRPGSMGSAPSSARRFCTGSSLSPLMSASESLSTMA